MREESFRAANKHSFIPTTSYPKFVKFISHISLRGMMSPSRSAEEALREAEAEGLTVLRSERSSTGYKGVSFNRPGNPKPYQTQVQRGGRQVHLGCFATPEEAALVVARSPEAQAAAAAPLVPPPMTAEAALRQAEAEGLTLLRADNTTGFKCVHFTSTSGKNKPYQVQMVRGGKTTGLGTFATAEEAALCYARTPQAQAAAAVPPEPPPLTAEEALRQAEAEGLTLLRSESGRTGYKGVCFNNACPTKPYRPQVKLGGRLSYLGSFVTAEEAALALARDAAAPEQPSTPSSKRKATTEAEPPSTPVVTHEGQFESECRLSERFEELEECRKRGFMTDEEYAQKRAHLMACF
mgnify:CR=1 FL=1